MPLKLSSHISIEARGIIVITVVALVIIAILYYQFHWLHLISEYISFCIAFLYQEAIY